MERRDLEPARNPKRGRSYCRHDHLQGSALLRDEGAGQQPEKQVCIFTFIYLLMCMNLIEYYILTVHTVHSLFLTIFGIRRELAVRQQQTDDTVGGEGI